jgi:hypothetical protein
MKFPLEYLDFLSAARIIISDIKLALFANLMASEAER